MRLECDFQKQVAGRPAVEAGTALSRQADALAAGHTARDLDLQIAQPAGKAAVRIVFGDAQLQSKGGTVECVLEADLDPGVMILSTTGDTPATGEAGTAMIRTLSEQALEEIRKAATSGIGRTATGKLEPGIPTRWRPEILAGAPVLAQLVVGRALFRVPEHLVGLTELLEAALGIRLFADIRVIFARQLAVGALDLVLRRFAGHAHHRIVVFVVHRSTPVVGKSAYPGGKPGAAQWRRPFLVSC